jgi:hypothetical protein
VCRVALVGEVRCLDQGAVTFASSTFCQNLGASRRGFDTWPAGTLWWTFVARAKPSTISREVDTVFGAAFFEPELSLHELLIASGLSKKVCFIAVSNDVWNEGAGGIIDTKLAQLA